MKTTYLSKETNEIQRVISLRTSRNKRYRHEEFIIEGATAIEQAFKNNWMISKLFFNRDKELSNWAKTYISNQPIYEIYGLSHEMMLKISD